MNLNKLCDDCAEPPAKPLLPFGLRRVLLLAFLMFLLCGFASFMARHLRTVVKLKHSSRPSAVPAAPAQERR